MANTFQYLVAVIAFAPSVLFAQANDPAQKTDDGDMLLDPSTITITGHFETSPSPTTLDLALRSLREQMDQKHAADAAQSPLEPLWKSPLWKYLPSDPGGSLNSPVESLPDRLARNPLYLTDPFCTAIYLTLAGQKLDREAGRSDQRTLWFFGR